MSVVSNHFNIKEVLNILPHQYPFLLIDRVVDFKVFKYLKAIKNCSINEPFFQGHFLKNPIFPGVLIIESMVQASSLLIYKSTGKLNINTFDHFIGVDNTRFKKIVIPGDQIFIEAFFLKCKRNIIKFRVIASVDKITVCKSTIIFSQEFSYWKNMF